MSWGSVGCSYVHSQHRWAVTVWETLWKVVPVIPAALDWPRRQCVWLVAHLQRTLIIMKIKPCADLVWVQLNFFLPQVCEP